MGLLDEIMNGRTDQVFEYVAAGNSSDSTDGDGVSLLQWCSYYGDVSGIKFLLANGASIESLGENLGLLAASFHGHWKLCKFLLERGADANRCEEETGETPLHRAAAFGDGESIQLLLDAGAKIGAKDINGDSPLSWASWYARPDSTLRRLLFGEHRIHPERKSMEANVEGNP